MKESKTTQTDKTTIEDEASMIIAKSAAKASGLAAIPIPFVDLVGSAYIQIDMVRKLAGLFGLSNEDNRKHILSAIVTSIIGKVAIEAFTSMIETTHIEKVVSKSLVSATVCGFITTVTGEIFYNHFQKGGNMLDFNIASYTEYVNAQIESDRLSFANMSSSIVDQLTSNFK